VVDRARQVAARLTGTGQEAGVLAVELVDEDELEEVPSEEDPDDVLGLLALPFDELFALVDAAPDFPPERESVR
jgi:hypothetical protein